MVRKLKIKYAKRKDYTSRKEGIIYLCSDQDNEDLFMHIKTKAYKCEVEAKLIAQIKETFDLPRKQLTISQMSPEEQEFFNLTEGKIPSVASRYDTESVAYKKVENEINALMAFASVASSFQMDEKIEVDGVEITHWENFKLKPNDWIGLVHYLVDEDKLGLGLGELNIIATEIQSVKLGQDTIAQKLLSNEYAEYRVKEEIEQLKEVDENEAGDQI